MNIKIELTEKDLRRLVLDEITRQTGISGLKETDVKIETKSSQNYKAEWEEGAGFRARIDKAIP